ncbi:MAG TPA: sigma-70 family RNA polymerase sigma factor [Clostridiales bacterium]|nr:sigma-70 family RNA polymerase sigma factor [Clostridiales bacterium]
MSKDELNQLIIDYGKEVYSFCCNLTGNRPEADDLYQDTLLKAVELCHRLDSSGNPKSFLMGISVRLWQNHRKKYAVRQNIVKWEELDGELMQGGEGSHLQPEEEALRKERRHLVRRVVKGLPDKLQLVLYLYYTAEMSVEDIGRALHIPKGTVKSRLHKGRKLVKELLEVQDYGI